MSPLLIGRSVRVIGRIGTGHFLDCIIDNIRQLFSRFPIGFKRVSGVIFQKSKAVFENVTNKRLLAPPFNQFPVDRTGNFLNFRDAQQLFGTERISVNHVSPRFFHIDNGR
jgi:hypothetical protein